MRRIVLEVDDTIALKWLQASNSTKKYITEILEQALAGIKENTGAADEARQIRIQQATDFFNSISIDFSGYKFNRDEANDR